MRSIAFINQKGGVGKTTSAVNTAAALARMNQRVLLVDLDPQAHATLSLGVEVAPDAPTIYEVLIRDAALAEAVVYADERVTVAPSHVDLVAADLELFDKPRREFRLADCVAAHREHYDFLIIDCPPSLGLLTLNALVAAEEVIIPLQPHFFALQGLGKLLQTATLVRQNFQPRLRIAGVLLCLYDHGTKLSAEVLSDVRSFFESAEPGSAWHGALVFDARVRRNIKLAESPSFGKSVFAYAPGSHGAEDYAAFARQLLQIAPPPRSMAEPDVALARPHAPSADDVVTVRDDGAA